MIRDGLGKWTALSASPTSTPAESSASLNARAAKSAGSGTVRRLQMSGPPWRISPVHANDRRWRHAVQPEAGLGRPCHGLGTIVHHQREAAGMVTTRGGDPSRAAGRICSVMMFSLKEREDAAAANHSLRSRGSHSGLSSGPEKYVGVTNDSAIDMGDPFGHHLVGELVEHDRTTSEEAVRNARVPRAVQDQVAPEMSIHDGTVGEQEGLIPKSGPEKVKRSGCGHDLHVRRWSQRTIRIL